MLPSDLTLARLCASSETDASGFDYIDEGNGTGVWWGLQRQQDFDIICFRGSITIEDWWRDAHTEMISLPGCGLVHAGFAQGMPVAKDRILSKVNQSLVITGHSLGAARAAILAAMIQAPAAHVALFGCPRPGSHTIAERLADTSISSYRNRRDPVTDVPLPLPPEFPYVHARAMIAIDGMVDFSLGAPWDDHHIVNYMKGLENAKYETSG